MTQRMVFFGGLACLGLGLILVPVVFATMGTPLFNRHLEPVAGYRTGAAITLRLTLSPTYVKVDSVMVEVKEIGNLRYVGPKEWVIYAQDDSSFTKEFRVVIPNNDTSAVQFWVQWGNHPRPIECPYYFVTTGDTIEVTPGKPVHPGKMPWEVRAQTMRMGDSLRKARAERDKKPFLGIGRTGPVMNPEDSAIVATLSDQDKRLWGTMRIMERAVLTDEDRQVIWIAGKAYVRDRGEQKFRHDPGTTNIAEDSQRRTDSIVATRPEAYYDMILDLRDPRHYEFARKIVDSLKQTKDQGYYRTTVSKTNLGKMAEQGITFKTANRPPPIPLDSAKTR